MDFSRKYDTRIPQLTERIHEFLRTKHLTGLVEHEFQNANEPTGWAILTVDTADPKLHYELEGFISILERIAVLELEPGLSRDSAIRSRSLKRSVFVRVSADARTESFGI
jgi:hypothetical protein